MKKPQLHRLVMQYASNGESIRSIAKRFKINRYQVEKILAAPGKVSTTQEPDVTSLLQSHHEQITEWWYKHHLPVKVIHNKLRKTKVSYSSVYRYLKKLKKREVHIPIVNEGCEVEFDYLGVFTKETRKVKVWIFNMVFVNSRYAFYKIVTDQTMNTFLECHSEAFEFFGGVPVCITINRLGADVFAADFYEPVFQKKYNDFLKHYNTTAITVHRAKGKTESGIKYFKKAFLKNIRYNDFYLLKEDLSKWMNNECNMRVHSLTNKIPLEEYTQHEKVKLTPLSASKYEEIKLQERKANNYAHIHFKNNYYSVPSQYAGDTVQVQADGEELKVYYNDILIATHVICKGQGYFETINTHKPFHKRDKPEFYYEEQARQIGPNALALLQLMQTEQPFHWKKMFKGIYALRRVYADILEKACAATVEDSLHTYRRVRHHCERITHEPPEEKVFKGANGYYTELSVYNQLLKRK